MLRVWHIYFHEKVGFMIHVGTYSNLINHLGFEYIVFTIIHMMGEITDVTPKFCSLGNGFFWEIGGW